MFIRFSNLAHAMKFNGLEGTLARNLGITLAETIATKSLNFLLILMLARILGPAEYGRYSFIFVTMALASALFDLGMENTAVRFAARDPARSNAIFGLYLGVKSLILVALIGFFALGGGWLFQLLHKPEMTAYMPYLIIGLLGESLFFVNDTYLQARQWFIPRAILNISRYGACLGYVWVLAAMDMASLERIFYLYLIPVAFSLQFVPNYCRFFMAAWRDKLPPGTLSEIAHYEKWMALYAVANNLLGRIDFFLLGLWVSYDGIGIYNAAFQLCAVVSFLPFVLGKVLLPSLAGRGEREIFDTVDRVFQTTALLAMGGLLLIPAVPFVLPKLLGPDYLKAIPVLQVLLAAFLTGLVTMPFEQALYAMGRPQAMCLGRYWQLALAIALNIATIPAFGIMAAACNALVSRMAYLAFIRMQYAALQPVETNSEAPETQTEGGALCPTR